jgi:hypothetical protein
VQHGVDAPRNSALHIRHDTKRIALQLWKNSCQRTPIDRIAEPQHVVTVAVWLNFVKLIWVRNNRHIPPKAFCHLLRGASHGIGQIQHGAVMRPLQMIVAEVHNNLAAHLLNQPRCLDIAFHGLREDHHICRQIINRRA